MKIATILANQTLSDLKKRVDLTGTVMANTRLKQYFSSTDLVQQQILIDASGEAIDYSENGLTERARELLNNNGETATQDEDPMGSEKVVPRISRAKADSEPHCPVDPVPPVGPLYDAVEAKPRHGTSKFDEAFESIVAGQKARQSKQKQRRKS